VRGARWLLARLLGVVGGLAGDSLLRNAGRTTITVGVLAFTAATAIGLGTALGSFESEMRSSFTARYGAPLYVTASSYSGITSDQPIPARVGGQLRRVEGVEAVYPLRYRPANVEGEQAVIASAPLGRQVRDGVRTAVDDTEAGSRRSLMSGLGRGGVVPSRLTAERHDLDVGQIVRIPGPKGESRLRVVGIFEDVLSVDSVYMERSTYRKLSGDSTVDHFAIAPRPGTSLPVLAGRLERSLTQHRVNASVQTRAEVIDAILGNVRGMFAIARGLQIAALLIAGMVVANTMFTVVAERRWELALSRALGATRTQVGAVVLLEALGIGLVGGAAAMLAGVAIGVLMLTSMELRFSWTIDLQLQWALMGAVFAIGVAGALLAALLPAYSATRAPLAGSLRSE
jgi:ABC-type lipoprotein release transport system permease subunit